jgi:hypothetical protein
VRLCAALCTYLDGTYDPGTTRRVRVCVCA